MQRPFPAFKALTLCGLAIALSAASPSPMANAAMPMASPLAGTWVLEAADTLRPDGVRIHGYGPNPQGRLMIDRNGDYALEIYRAESIKFASGDKAKGAPAEYQDAVLRLSAHIGHVTMDPTNHTLTFEIANSLFPNWEGAKQIRHYTLMGDKLSYQVPASATGDGTVAISEWRRTER